MELENDIRKAAADSIWEDRGNHKNHIQKAVKKSLMKGLENDVKKFLAENIHAANYGRPFELDYLIDRGSRIEVRLKGVEEQDLQENDFEWHGKLWEMGIKYGVHLNIPIWYYAK